MTTSDIRREFFSPPYPVTTTVQVARLYHPDLMMEITAIAEIPRARFRPPPAATHAPGTTTFVLPATDSGSDARVRIFTGDPGDLPIRGG